MWPGSFTSRSARDAEWANGAPAATAETPMDRVRALRQMDGDADLLDQVLDAFRPMLPGVIDTLRQAARTRDLRAIQIAAHSMKGSAANICADAVRIAAARLESAARQGETEAIPPLAQALIQQLEHLERYLNERPTAAEGGRE